MASLPGHSSKKRLKPSPSASFQALRSLCRSGTRGRRCAPTIHCQNFLKKKTADFLRNQRFYGCGDRTRTCDLRVMRQSQAQIGVISAPICAFYRHSLGGFSIVSIQSCPVFRILGQNWVRHGVPAPTPTASRSSSRRRRQQDRLRQLHHSCSPTEYR